MYILHASIYSFDLTPFVMDNPGLQISNENDEGCNNKYVDYCSTSLNVNSTRVELTEDKQLPKTTNQLLYTIEDVPSWYITFFLGLQHFLTMFGPTVSIPYLLAPALCIGPNDPARAYLISTIIFVSGLVTFLQTTIGVRLPILQGGTFSFLAPTFAILSLPEWKCPEGMVEINGQSNSTRYSQQEKDSAWHERICEVQGAIIVAAIVEFVIGITGLVGFLLRFITPLVIAPVITLVGLSLFQDATNLASGNWTISLITIIMILVFTLYMSNISIPCGTYTSKNGCQVSKVPVFKLFPVLLALVIMWIACSLLTRTNVLSKQDPARTDLKINILENSPWFRFPYPFQWGFPTFSVAAGLGMMGGVLATIVESIGDYYACANLCGAPPPPVHAINRGMLIEGVGTILAGIWGTGNGTISYGENIGIIGVTKVGSRRVLQAASIIMVVFGLISKLGALFVTIPEPLMGGIFFVTFAMIAAIGLSQIQHVDLNSQRNLLILGISLFCGLAIPNWFNTHKDVVRTGHSELDNIIQVSLSTSMFVGGVIALILDNTVPGSDDERGLTKWKMGHGENSSGCQVTLECYDLPFGMKWIRNCSWARFIPFSPTYEPSVMACKRKYNVSDQALTHRF